jgi:probable rRNA maturation factor
MIAVEVSNLTQRDVEDEAAAALARRVLESEGVSEAEVGIVYVSPARISELKAEHLGTREETDVLAFPIDGREELPPGLPRQLGDVVLCPDVVGEEWRGPLVHGLLHLLGYEHGREMRSRERAHRS